MHIFYSTEIILRVWKITVNDDPSRDIYCIDLWTIFFIWGFVYFGHKLPNNLKKFLTLGINMTQVRVIVRIIAIYLIL